MAIQLDYPKCFLCGKEAKEEDYCYGCGKFICSECDEITCVGDHEPEEHRKGEG